MKVVFFGSSKFSLPSLIALAKTEHEVVAVITPPDKKGGRGLKLRPTAVKDYALKNSLEILQPQNPSKDKGFESKLKKFNAEVFIIISYGHILSSYVLNLANSFAINVHPSLLPKYRGAAPVNWAIINGDKKTGITIFKVTEKVDAGPIIYQEEEDILKEDNSVSLGKRLSEKAPKVLLKSLSMIKQGSVKLVPQQAKEATFAPKLKKKDGLINFNQPAYKLHNKIKGMLDWPTAFTFFRGKRIEILKSNFDKAQSNYPTSTVIDVGSQGIKVATKEGILLMERLKPEGKKEISACDFARGYRVKEGDSFG